MKKEITRTPYEYHYKELANADFLPESDMKAADLFLTRGGKGYRFTRVSFYDIPKASFHKLIIFLKKKGIIVSQFIRYCDITGTKRLSISKEEYLKLKLAVGTKTKEEQKALLMEYRLMDCNETDCPWKEGCLHKEDYKKKETLKGFLEGFQEVYEILR